MPDHQITIVEGPPPEFILSEADWALSVIESPEPFLVATCQTRCYDAQSLVDRCTRAWDKQVPIHLDFPTPAGLRSQSEIIAAQAAWCDDGDLLNLWIKVPVAR